jgi:hypothetical protein
MKTTGIQAGHPKSRKPATCRQCKYENRKRIDCSEVPHSALHHRKGDHEMRNDQKNGPSPEVSSVKSLERIPHDRPPFAQQLKISEIGESTTLTLCFLFFYLEWIVA